MSDNSKPQAELKYLLKKPFNFIHGVPNSAKNIVEVRLFQGKAYQKLECFLLDQAGGGQPFRTQYDISLSGTEHVLAAGRGRGSYELRLLEGPFENCTTTTPAEEMTLSKFYHTTMINTFNGRRIEIVTGADVENSTANRWMFRGLIDNIATAAHVGEDGYRYILNIITATGLWL